MTPRDSRDAFTRIARSTRQLLWMTVVLTLLTLLLFWKVMTL
jgi:cell division septal protein FtsQ